MELAGKKVLITGGAGFIGSHLVDLLLRLGSQITVYDRFDDFYPGKEANVQEFLGRKGFRLVRDDILNSEALGSAMKGADVVFHLAAQAGVRYCMQFPNKANEVNVTGTLNVLEAARKNKVKKLIYASSSSVYGVPVRVPMDEGHPQLPTNLYGATKLAAEKYCLSYHVSYGMDVVCLRYFSVYGPRGRPDQAITAFAESIMRGVSPRIFGDGTQSRDFTYVADAVSATALSAMNDVSGEVFNVGYGKDYSIKFVAERIAKYFGSPIRPEYIASYSADFPRTLCSNSKAMKDLGWRPEIGFEEGLRRFLDWYSSKGMNTSLQRKEADFSSPLDHTRALPNRNP